MAFAFLAPYLSSGSRKIIKRKKLLIQEMNLLKRRGCCGTFSSLKKRKSLIARA
jgi:hypothetical protein